MGAAFYSSAMFAILAIALALTSRQAVHGLLYLLLGLMSVALNLYVLGNELGAVLLMIVYAGAIMVLFVFVVMLLNPAPTAKTQLFSTLFAKQFLGPLILAFAIFVQLVFVSFSQGSSEFSVSLFTAKDIASALFQDGWVFIELLSLLLTAALIGAFHVGRQP